MLGRNYQICVRCKFRVVRGKPGGLIRRGLSNLVQKRLEDMAKYRNRFVPLEMYSVSKELSESNK